MDESTKKEQVEIDQHRKTIAGVCKARDITKAITFAWYGIGREWFFDETDTELIHLN